MSGQFRGLLVPVLTPFDAQLAPDAKRLTRLCEQLLNCGADGLAVFGTTSEAISMSAAERKSLLGELRSNGIPGEKLMPGIGSCSISETADLLIHAGEHGAAGALLLPPFFYKESAATDDGLFDFFAAVMNQTDGVSTQIYLYHIPPIAHVGWSLPLVGRLLDAFPDRIAGLKDSSGDWQNTKSLIETYPKLDVFPGSDEFLLRGLRAGGVGCITATGNINPIGIRAIYSNWQTDDADSLQKQATDIRMAVQAAGNPITVMKAYFALKTGEDDWARVRPPLTSLSRESALSLDTELTKLGFTEQFNIKSIPI
jgi:4-hydroxy-tetrahydrodipicolinate synthase